MRWNQHSLPIKHKAKDAYWTRTQNATVLRRSLLCLFCIIGVSSCVKRHWWSPGVVLGVPIYDGLTVPSMRIDAAPATVVLCATYSLVTPVFTASERTSLSAKCPNRTHRHLQELESEAKVTD